MTDTIENLKARGKAVGIELGSYDRIYPHKWSGFSTGTGFTLDFAASLEGLQVAEDLIAAAERRQAICPDCNGAGGNRDNPNKWFVTCKTCDRTGKRPLEATDDSA